MDIKHRKEGSVWEKKLVCDSQRSVETVAHFIMKSAWWSKVGPLRWMLWGRKTAEKNSSWLYTSVYLFLVCWQVRSYTQISLGNAISERRSVQAGLASAFLFLLHWNILVHECLPLWWLTENKCKARKGKALGAFLPLPCRGNLCFPWALLLSQEIPKS